MPYARRPYSRGRARSTIRRFARRTLRRRAGRRGGLPRVNHNGRAAYRFLLKGDGEQVHVPLTIPNVSKVLTDPDTGAATEGQIRAGNICELNRVTYRRKTSSGTVPDPTNIFYTAWKTGPPEAARFPDRAHLLGGDDTEGQMVYLNGFRGIRRPHYQGGIDGTHMEHPTQDGGPMEDNDAGSLEDTDPVMHPAGDGLEENPDPVADADGGGNGERDSQPNHIRKYFSPGFWGNYYTIGRMRLYMQIRTKFTSISPLPKTFFRFIKFRPKSQLFDDFANINNRNNWQTKLFQSLNGGYFGHAEWDPSTGSSVIQPWEGFTFDADTLRRARLNLKDFYIGFDKKFVLDPTYATPSLAGSIGRTKTVKYCNETHNFFKRVRVNEDIKGMAWAYVVYACPVGAGFEHIDAEHWEVHLRGTTSYIDS